ncbi:unnamed protein product, partial [Didymodactylos carnosus]
KLAIPLRGVKRGCGENRCNVQIDTGVFQTANLCCDSNLCNSAPKSTNVFIVASTSVILGLVLYYYH